MKGPHIHILIAFAIVAGLVTASCKSSSREDRNRQAFREPHCLEDIYGSTLALVMGGLYDSDFEAKGIDKKFDILYTGISECLVAVSSGKADYTISDSTTAVSVDLKSMGLEIKFGGVLPHGYSLLFAKNRANYCEKFNEFLGYASEKHIYDKIFRKWTTELDAPKAKEPLDLPTEGEALRIGVGGASFPWVYYTADNGVSGFQADMMDYFSVWSGIPVQYISTDNSALTAMIETDKADCLFLPLQRTPEREKIFVYSEPYFYDVGVVIGKIHEDSGSSRISFVERLKNDINSNLIVENRWKLLVDGLWITLLISVLSIIASLLSGALICAMRMSRHRLISSFAKSFIAVIRCIPMLVLLMIMFYVVFKSSRMSGIWISVVCFAIYHGTYFSEMFRSGIESISKGQYEAGAALGLNRFQTFRLVILPQALLNCISVIKGEIITLIKSTSLVGYVAIQDLTRASDLIRSRTMDAFFLLLLVALVYALISWGTGIILNRIEKSITPKSKII